MYVHTCQIRSVAREIHDRVHPQDAGGESGALPAACRAEGLRNDRGTWTTTGNGSDRPGRGAQGRVGRAFSIRSQTGIEPVRTPAGADGRGSLACAARIYGAADGKAGWARWPVCCPARCPAGETDVHRPYPAPDGKVWFNT